MALTLTYPNEFAYLKNLIGATLQETAVNFSRFLYKVTVALVDSEEFEAYRDATNQAEINISALLAQFFDVASYPLPTLPIGDLVVFANQTEICVPYIFTAKSQYTAGPDDTETANLFAVWGGTSYVGKATDTSLVPSLANTYVCLNALAGKQTTPTGLELLTFLNINLSNTPTQFRLEWEAFDIDGASIYTDFQDLPTNLDKGKTMLIDASYSTLLATLTQDAYSYKVRVKAVYNSQNYLSSYFTFTVDHDYKPQTTELLYINSRGGLSTIRLFGEREDMHEATREETNRYQSVFATAPTSGKFSRVNNEMEMFKIATGYLETWQDYLEILDLFRSQSIWEISNDTLIPVSLETKKIPTFSTNQLEYPSATLDFKYLVLRFAL